MRFSLMFFSGNPSAATGNPYRMMLETTKFGDREGFAGVWTPERHFHELGGLFPNPAVTSAALATVTERIQLRSGSLISPLHHTIRIAEEWSVVDNLSNGRAAISFGSGWNVNDFLFFPDRYESRAAVMYQQIDLVRKLWSGQTLIRQNTYGKDVTVRVYPVPVQKELPIWVTTSGNPETFISAGKLGANLLTHLIGQDLDSLQGKVESYRQAREQAGFDPAEGIVSLMLHTHLGEDEERVRMRVRAPFREYLRTAVKLEQGAAAGGGAISGGHKIEAETISHKNMEELLDLTFERYYHTGSLLGTPRSCLPMIDKLRESDVDEVACLVDFIDDVDAVLSGLPHLAALKEQAGSQPADSDEDWDF